MSDFTAVTVTARYTRAPGQASSGSLTFQLNADLVNDSTWDEYVSTPLQVYLDDTGFATASLIATDDPTTTPTGAVWTVAEYIDGRQRPAWSFSLSTTDAPTIDLKALAPVEPLTLQYPYATAASVRTETSRAEAAEALLAPKASPAFIDTPTAPTAAPLTNDTQLATTAYADAADAVVKAAVIAAIPPFGTTAGTAAEGNDSRIVGAMAKINPSPSSMQTTVRKLSDGISDVTVAVLGDSMIALWLPTFAAALQSVYPARSCRVYVWNDTTNGYTDPPTSYGAAGTGSTWINIYQGSKGGSIWDYALTFASARFGALQPDLIAICYGVNEGNTATPTTREAYTTATQRLAAVAKAYCPTADLLLISQSPRLDAGYQADLGAVRAQSVRTVAADAGAAYGAVFEAFNALATPSSALNSDLIHPNPTIGVPLYSNTLLPLFLVQPNVQPTTRVLSSLLTPASNGLLNGDFADFVTPPVLTSWTAINCTLSKDTTNFESPNGYGVNIAANAAAMSRIEQTLTPATGLNRFLGRVVTAAIRMYVPASIVDNVTGRVELYTTGAAVNIDVQSPGTQSLAEGFFVWEYISVLVPIDATALTCRVIAGATTSSTAQITVDRVILALGHEPRDLTHIRPIPSAARTNLGLGNSSTKDTGTTPGTVAAGDDSRFLGLVNGLVAGEIVPNRELVNSSAVSPTSGTLGLVYWTADKTETINNLTVWTGATAAGATPTLCRLGIYQIDASGNGTLVASTVNNTGLYAVINTQYTVALSSPFSKVAGQRYATAILTVSGAAMPSFLGPLPLSVPGVSTVFFVAPQIVGRIVTQTDLPGSFVASAAISYQQRVMMQLS